MQPSTLPWGWSGDFRPVGYPHQAGGIGEFEGGDRDEEGAQTLPLAPKLAIVRLRESISLLFLLP